MLLHDSDMNVAITHILVCLISFSDSKYKNPICTPQGNSGRGSLGFYVKKQKLYLYDSGPGWHQKQ